MYFVDKSHEDKIVCVAGYTGRYKNAPKKILKHLFHLGDKYVQKKDKAPKNIIIDNETQY